MSEGELARGTIKRPHVYEKGPFSRHVKMDVIARRPPRKTTTTPTAKTGNAAATAATHQVQLQEKATVPSSEAFSLSVRYVSRHQKSILE